MTDEDLNKRFDALATALQAQSAALATALQAHAASVKEEMDRRFEGVAELISHLTQRMDARFDEVNQRMDDMSKRLTLQGGLLNSGSRAMVRIIEWTDKTDNSIAFWGQKIQDLDARLSALEKRPRQ